MFYNMNEQLEEIREQRESKVGSIFKYFSAIMGFFYMVFGVVFYFFPFIEKMDSWAKLGVSAVLFLYGAFRLKRALWK
jgi:hypothetical protein